MTCCTWKAVKSEAHAKSLRGYLDTSNERHDVLGFDTQNIERPRSWWDECARTRVAYGHDRPARRGAANTIMAHVILAFQPDECDVNGGRMTPARCMEYAMEWCARFYPYSEAAWALHREKAPDGTQRYACHVAMNRSLLDGSGRRLDEGQASKARAKHVRQVRELDAEWGLSQLQRGRNSKSHRRQEAREETRAREGGRRRDPGYETDLDRLRRDVRECVEQVRASGTATPKRDLSAALADRGVGLRVSARGDDLVFTYRPSARRDGREPGQRRISGARLGRGFSLAGVVHGLGAGAAKAAARETARAAERFMDGGCDDEMGMGL